MAIDPSCVFSTSYIIQDKAELYREIQKLDEEELKYSMVMMDPLHIEGLKSTISSDYVVPAVRGIVDAQENVIGYVVLYFDYGVIDKMFSVNLPKGSVFRVNNEKEPVFFLIIHRRKMQRLIYGILLPQKM